jgi:dihydrofolate reductase
VGEVFVDISVSLDGFVAGPEQTLSEPLGDGGMQLHEWVLGTAAWRKSHGREGGEAGPDSDLVTAVIERTGAVVMGRRMFSGGAGTWEEDQNANGWWGDQPPFRCPVFVVTHHERADLPMQGGTTFHFVTDGVEAAIERARAAAGEKDVSLAGGAGVIQQGLRAGLVDDLHLHVAPVLLGAGTRLFDEVPAMSLAGPPVTHLRYHRD